MSDGLVKILDGNTFVVSDGRGDIEASPVDPTGLFSFDTRFLSKWILTVDGARMNALSVDVRQRTGWVTRFRRGVLPPLVAIVVVLAAWQAFVAAGIRPTYVVPGPADVWSAFVEQWQDGNVASAVWNSLRRGLLGFAVAIVVAE